MRMTKQREAARREREIAKEEELKRINEEHIKQQKNKSDKLSKRNHTFGFDGKLIFIRKPVMDTMPQDFNTTKVAKKSLKKPNVVPPKVEQSADNFMQKYFNKGKVVRQEHKS